MVCVIRKKALTSGMAPFPNAWKGQLVSFKQYASALSNSLLEALT